MALTPFAWSPSGQRVIAVGEVAFTSPSTSAPAVLPLRWPDTPAGSTLDYGLDFSALIPAGDTVASAVIDAGSLQLVASVTIGAVVTVWLTGGASGTDYPVDVTIATTGGRTIDRTARLMLL